MKDLLPIGSVVTLKEGTKKLMIMGRLQQNMKTKKLYDYAGCELSNRIEKINSEKLS